ncbi:hypothetical protein THRCLA_00076 [Thraustotheca clavata]|uniref:Uncharacterized protein n=1 Tax=Thraustotheca clavata TaxID=74557 RepID=A0A1W0ACC5_9STRA|nr:hypothetical protein THRCLA_00076 [Thraustotheca clavata]
MEAEVDGDDAFLYEGKKSAILCIDKNEIQGTTREERLRKDRLRKRLSKEKFQKELNELHRMSVALEYQLNNVKNRRNIDSSKYKEYAEIEKARLQQAYCMNKALYQELILQMEKAVLLKSICPPASDFMMIIDPRRDPWALHTLSKNPQQQAQVLHNLAMYQWSKITPELYGKMPSSVNHPGYNIVLDDTGEHVSFAEMTKFGTFAASHEDVAHALHRYCLSASNNKHVTPVDNSLALTVFLDKQRHYVVNLIRESPDRMILTHRTLVYDDMQGQMAQESIAGWWVFERLPSSDNTIPMSVMRCFAQINIDVNKEMNVQAYTTHMINSGRENELMNQVLSQFPILSLR